MHQHVFFPAILVILFLATLSSSAQAQTTSPEARDQIVASMGITPGMIIGEGGSGRGAFTFAVAAKTGATGRLYANDIDKAALAVIDSTVKAQKIQNITTVVGKADDPLFPVKNLDIVFLRYVVHHMENPVGWMKNVVPYLKPGAPLVLIEWDAAVAPVEGRPFLTKQAVLDIMAKTDFVLDHVQNFGNDNVFYYKVKK